MEIRSFYFGKKYEVVRSPRVFAKNYVSATIVSTETMKAALIEHMSNILIIVRCYSFFSVRGIKLVRVFME
jgi:hypothetical protein